MVSRCAHRGGGAADGPADGSVRDRSVRREQQRDVWHDGDLKVLRCAGCPGEGARPRKARAARTPRVARVRGARDVTLWL
jgi:hypothetical protein